MYVGGAAGTTSGACQLCRAGVTSCGVIRAASGGGGGGGYDPGGAGGGAANSALGGGGGVTTGTGAGAPSGGGSGGGIGGGIALFPGPPGGSTAGGRVFVGVGRFRLRRTTTRNSTIASRINVTAAIVPKIAAISCVFEEEEEGEGSLPGETPGRFKPRSSPSGDPGTPTEISSAGVGPRSDGGTLGGALGGGVGGSLGFDGGDGGGTGAGGGAGKGSPISTCNNRALNFQAHIDPAEHGAETEGFNHPPTVTLHVILVCSECASGTRPYILDVREPVILCSEELGNCIRPRQRFRGSEHVLLHLHLE